MSSHPTHFSKERRHLFQRLLRKKGLNDSLADGIPRRDPSVACPASFAQQRLWYLDQFEGAGFAYYINNGMKLSGLLDPVALRAALDTLVTRHEVLRTTFGQQGEEIVQTVSAIARFTLVEVDLSDHDPSQRAAHIRQHARDEIRTPFDLRSGPLIRGRLLRVAENEHLLFLSMHHIVSDGWSMGILTRELAALYGAYHKGKPDPLPPLAIQYSDYAQWQRQWVAGEGQQRQLDYWKQELADAPELLALPTDRRRPAIRTSRGDAVGFAVDAELTRRLNALAAQRGATLYMTLLTAFGILLSHLSGQDDVVIGTPVANRQRTETEALIGCFVNTLALRVRRHDASGNEMTVGQLLSDVKARTLAAYGNQDVPFEKVVEALNPVRSLGHAPIFQAMLILQNTPQGELYLPGLILQPLPIPETTAKFDLVLSLQESESGLRGTLNYAVGLFDRTTIERWIVHFRTILRDIVSNPDRNVTAVELLTERERDQVVEQFNATQSSYPRTHLIHELFEEHTELSGDATALIHGQEHLSYAELNRRANQVGHALRGFGVGADQRVGICLDRGLGMVEGMLGTLKAGGAYVPLDAAYPAERLGYLLRDARPRVLLTDRPGVWGWSSEGLATLVPEQQWQALQSQPETNLEVGKLGVQARHLAYVLYTSGSTGQPKGVMIEHGNAVNLLCWAREAYPREQLQETLFSTSINFDLSVFELFVPLAAGGRVRIVDHALQAQGQDCGQVTLLNTVPSALSALLGSGGIAGTTQAINLAGEVLERGLAERAFAGTGVGWINNLYGPTECTTYSTWVRMSAAEGFQSHIGGPIANTQIYIVDEHLQPVPIGVVGQICIGGAGVARGYLHRPELTAERFIADSFRGDPRGRLYKSGDLGRWRADGAIEYLGRTDQQVKVRGFRVEPREVEAALLSHEAVSQALVLAREDIFAGKRLVAYLISPAARLKAAAARTSGNASQRLVNEWRDRHDNLFATRGEIAGPQFEGSNGFYTVAAIAPEAMEEWLAATLQRIRALAPKRVLEIGCGTGLVLRSLAPDCEVYEARDFSIAALAQLRDWMSARAGYERVVSTHAEAAEVSGLEAGSFDTLILNAVIQYFPDCDYLLKVLRQALPLISDGGRIFIGDVKNLDLLESLYAAVESLTCAPEVSAGELWARVRRAVQREQELVLAPEFFRQLPQRLEGIGAVDIQLRQGRCRNELTNYRYDVVLHVGRVRSGFSGQQQEYAGSESVDRLVRQLEHRDGEVFRLTGVKNARLWRDQLTLNWLREARPHQRIGELRQSLEGMQEQGEDPQRFWDLGERLGYEVAVSWSRGRAQGEYEVELRAHRSRGDRLPEARADAATDPATIGSVREANDPLAESLRQGLATQLTEALKERLPEYMIPAAYVVLEEFPLMPNGKIDRKALPAPEASSVETAPYVAPVGEHEQALATIWKELLHVPRVGRHDNFFQLGGHSLLAMSLLGKLKHLHLRIPLAIIFLHPTVSKLAAALHSHDSVRGLRPPVITLRSGGDSTPLFLLHEVGGDAVPYARLASLLPEGPVYGLQMSADDELISIEVLAAKHIDTIRTLQPHGPYRLAGLSLGGLLAYEVAFQLLGAEEPVEFVGMIDSFLPTGRSTTVQLGSETDALFRIVNDLAPQADEQKLREVRAMPDTISMYDKSVQLGLISPLLSLQEARRSIGREHRMAELTHRYSPMPLPIPVHMFAAEAALPAPLSRDWGPLLGKQLRMQTIAGAHHLTLMQDAHLPRLVEGFATAFAGLARAEIPAGERTYVPSIAIQIGAATAVPIFCVPGAGASVTSFISLVEAFGPRATIYGLQPRGIDSDLVPHSTVQAAARSCVRAIRAVAPHGPYRLLGHSFGGWVALETAHQLMADGERVDPVAILDSESPASAPTNQRRHGRLSILTQLIEVIEMTTGRALGLTAERLDLLDNNAQLNILQQRLVREGILPPNAETTSLERIVRVFTANVNTLYQPAAALPGKLILLPAVERSAEDSHSPLEAWRPYAAELQSFAVPGNHMTVLQSPNVRQIPAHLLKFWPDR